MDFSSENRSSSCPGFISEPTVLCAWFQEFRRQCAKPLSGWVRTPALRKRCTWMRGNFQNVAHMHLKVSCGFLVADGLMSFCKLYSVHKDHGQCFPTFSRVKKYPLFQVVLSSSVDSHCCVLFIPFRGYAGFHMQVWIPRDLFRNLWAEQARTSGNLYQTLDVTQKSDQDWPSIMYLIVFAGSSSHWMWTGLHVLHTLYLSDLSCVAAFFIGHPKQVDFVLLEAPSLRSWLAAASLLVSLGFNLGTGLVGGVRKAPSC